MLYARALANLALSEGTTLERRKLDIETNAEESQGLSATKADQDEAIQKTIAS